MSKIIEIRPKSQRARNRIAEHGKFMKVISESIFLGFPAILVESLEKTWKNKPKSQPEKWKGWFTDQEINYERFHNG